MNDETNTGGKVYCVGGDFSQMDIAFPANDNFPSSVPACVERIAGGIASALVVKNHYLHRAPCISAAFGLLIGGEVLGVCTFGIPASRHAQKSACNDNPGAVMELNRLWVSDVMPRNTESWFVSRCLTSSGVHFHFLSGHC